MHFDQVIKIVCSREPRNASQKSSQQSKKRKDNLKIVCNPRESMCPVFRGKEGKHLQQDLVGSFPSIATFCPLARHKSQSPGSYRGLQTTAGKLMGQMALTLKIPHGPRPHPELMVRSIS